MCWTTPQGWILLARARDQDAAVSSACLWNPSTGDKLPLPDIITHEIPYHNRCMLSTRTQLIQDVSPCSSVMKHRTSGIVTALVKAARTTASVGDITPTTSVIVLLYKPPKGKKARRSICPIKRVIPVMASLQEKIYFSKSSSKDNMCAIDFSSCTSTTNHNHPRFQKFNFPFVDLPGELSSGKKWLVESQDQLFAVTMGFTLPLIQTILAP
ncbi:unnamed protein product [Miscanthus lutarioriparius]|uniref:KIB1-4 beta-propeller domain-containing protein n=1 Tax=Miscanthus lutarioriparius TaxID=422564 RepID=A0A811RGJ4_9POAL|nr:unnamed protein product [Miscanthus lutarioriparius]